MIYFNLTDECRTAFRSGVIASLAFISLCFVAPLSQASFDFNSFLEFGINPMSLDHLRSDDLNSMTEVEVPLIHVTSDALVGFADINMLLDPDKNILGLVYLTSDHERAEFRKTQLSGGGIVLFKKKGYDIVKLLISESTFDLHSGGRITLHYLSNAVTGSSGNFPMELTRVGDTWQLSVNEQTGRRPFTQMYLKGNFFFGQALGIQGVSVK
jgi:hypothetical protein